MDGTIQREYSVKLDEMFPSKYVRGQYLQGRAFNVTITRIQHEKMRPNPQSPELDKFVLYVDEGKKGIVLSKTLASQIAQILGSDESDDWIGKKVTLFPVPMVVAGVRRVAIRARKFVDTE
jgi:hypothetical protein